MESQRPIAADAGESIRRHSRSFSLASRLLPASRRGDVERLYAWCRWCDDGVDHAASTAEAEAFVAAASHDLRLIAADKDPGKPESHWLADVSRRHPVSTEAAAALLAGMRWDLTPASRLGLPALLRYCFRAAGAVGAMMCPILGLRRTEFLPHAAALGMGMQLTNIARDVGEDWDRGRCYLPVDWTDGLVPTDSRPDTARVKSAVGRLLDLAETYYAAGEAGISALPRSSRLAVRAASRVYRAIGDRIRRIEYRVLDERAYVPTAQKLQLVLASAASVPSPRGPAVTDASVRGALETADFYLREHGVRL
ncbi:MAG: phytoene/squalene synthase family protein [Planctomycetota bacterium]